MLVPIRCFTCNAPVAHLWSAYLKSASDDNFSEFCEKHKLTRYCCARMLITHVDVGYHIAQYKYTDTNDGTSQFRCVAEGERSVSCD